MRDSDEIVDLQMVLKSYHGRRVLQRLLDFTGVEFPPFTGDQQRDTFTHGKVSVGVFLREAIAQADLEAFILMQREARANNDGPDEPDN